MGQVTVTTASDKTKIYNYEKAEKVFPNLKTKKFSRTDLVLILLCAQEQSIHGRHAVQGGPLDVDGDVLRGGTRARKEIRILIGDGAGDAQEWENFKEPARRSERTMMRKPRRISPMGQRREPAATRFVGEGLTARAALVFSMRSVERNRI